jgi:glycosyltransferase involved in cell wall biosynthesis
MQAGAMGLPSIVININGYHEIVIEGENRIIIPVKNSNARYEAMNKMMVNDDFREKLQKKCPTDDCCPIRTTSSLGGCFSGV